MTIGSLMEGGFRLVRERPGAMLIWTLIQLAATIGTSFWMAALVQNLFDAAMVGEASLESLQSSFLLQSLLVGIVSTVVSMVLYAAVHRAIIQPTEGGPGWLKLGMDEVRYFLLLVLCALIFGVAVVIMSVFLALFIPVAGPAGSPLMQILIIAVAFVVISYFGTKLSLCFPLTLKEETFAVGAGWRLSNGRFWTLFGAYFIIFLILLAVGIASSLVTEPEYLTASLRYGFGSPEADQASLLLFQRIAAGAIDAPIVIGWVLTALQGAIGAAFLGGAAATAVQELTSDEAALSETFS